MDADGVTYRICGRGKDKVFELPVLPQTECRVGATVTSYCFADGRGLSAEVDFTTPRMADDLEVFSRPVTYVTVRVSGAKEWSARVSITGAWATNDDKAQMAWATNVFYPQFPHLLMSSLTLAKATLAPTCIYAASTNWPYAYAPHDLGLFPVAEGQYYGMKKGQAVGGGTDDTYRMPVEECGNMLILLAAVAKAEGNADFAGRWWGEVTKWVEYLAKFGYDPGNQLCTDDFAGHLAHNANLSVKSIIALASYAEMAKMRGEEDSAKRYRALAKEMVPEWIEAAKGGAHGGTRIAFDRPNTWSLKYNLVWDRVLDLGLFPLEVAEAELRAYHALERPYGVPLDCRKTYTKADWLVWCGSMTGRREDLEFMCGGIHRFLAETPDRIPFSDWYLTDSRLHCGFIARSVVGGVFMPMLIVSKEK